MTELSIMSFNTGMVPTMNLPSGKKEFEAEHGRKPSNTFLQVEDVPMIARILRENPHDIYALQEVWTPELMERLREELGNDYVALFPKEARRGLLNKKFTGGIVHRELAKDAGFVYSTVDGYDRVPSLRVSTPEFDIYGVHLRAAFTGPAKVRELGGVVKDANERVKGRPQIIVGDFNIFENGIGKNAVAEKLMKKVPYLSYEAINGVLQLAAQDKAVKYLVSDFDDLGALVEGDAQLTTFQGLAMRPTRAYTRNVSPEDVDYEVLDDVFDAEDRKLFQDHFPVSVTIPL